jgi:tetraacyldisaccharide 4'-kinase
LVSGRTTGPQATLLRGLLRTLETPYTGIVRFRNRRFDTGQAQIHRAGVPIISVGNLTLGGTGKTPLVAWLARWFVERGLRVALVSRGYGAKSGQANDEALELAQLLPEVPHIQNPDRVAAARQAVLQHRAELILLDDGFQHRRLHRDLDIVLLDALEPFGFEHVFPRGTLREPIAGLERADIVALSRSNLIEEVARAELRKRVVQLAPRAVWCELVAKPQDLLAADGQRAEFATLAGQPVVACCAIGNPAGFAHTLDEAGLVPLETREFADHHRYTAADRTALAAWAEAKRATAMLCTHKDLVKLQQTHLGDCPLWAVTIGMEITAGKNELLARLCSCEPRV